MASDPPLRGAAVLLTRADGALLVVKDRRGDWAPPMGRLEDEDLDAAHTAQREVWEEVSARGGEGVRFRSWGGCAAAR